MLAEAGFDIAHPFDTARVAGLVPALAAKRRGILVGNTRALWAQFRAACARELAGVADPLERYTEDVVARAFPGAPVWFAHRRYASELQGERAPSGHADVFLPFQRIAAAAGLGVLAPTQLVIHPVYGPWFALRAIALVDGEPPAEVAPPRVPCCTGDCPARLDAALRSGGDWHAWLAVRDACPVGRAYRYSDEQIAYHYTKNRALLGR